MLIMLKGTCLNHVDKATDLSAFQPQGSTERGPEVNRAALDLQPVHVSRLKKKKIKTERDSIIQHVMFWNEFYLLTQLPWNE